MEGKAIIILVASLHIVSGVLLSMCYDEIGTWSEESLNWNIVPLSFGSLIPV